MSSQTAERMASRYQVPLAIGIVVLSIVLPFAMVCWSALAEMRDKGIAGSPSKVARYYLGSVQQGELWHAEMRLSSNLSAAPSECRILRLNLETGVEHDTGLKTPREFGRPQWMGGTLYFVTQAGIFRREGNEFAKLVTLPPPGSFHSSVFLWEGQLTMIRPDDDGGFRLVHVSDGEWINGRPILLPDATRVWYDDPQRGRRVLLPLTLQQPISIKTPVGLLAVEVVEHGQQHHVMVSDYNNFSAFRTGFEFADEPHAGVSALAPENAPRDVSGWEPISPAQANGNRTWMGMAASRDGLLFLSWDEPMKVARRKPEGTWEWFDFQREGERRGVYWFASDPASAHTYFIGADPRWGSAEVRRIEGRTVHRPHVVIPGGEPAYLTRWMRVGRSLLLAWLLHVALLMGGAAWLTRGVTQPEFEFGNQRATLAPLWRRAIATGLDAALLATVVVCLGHSLFAGLGITTTDPGKKRLTHTLFSIEQGLYGAITGTPAFATTPSLPPQKQSLIQMITMFPELVLIFMASLLVLCVVKVFVEGRYGVTPGKWLLGLRTIKTTLRPCGFARALVRNAIYYIDLPFFETPLPAAISLMFSDHRQRLGDRAADTLVIRAGSIRDTKSS